jgi:SAM-dependent methyltransferase
MSSNQEQIEYWNERAGETWAELQDRLDALLAPLSAAGLAAARVRPGERVLDVGCGCGDTTIALSTVGASVLGVDVSAPMLARARSRDASIEYQQADAATTDFARAFDLVFSRFGVMFFDDPTAAFKNLYNALKPGGRLLFVCWQPPAVNPWMATAGRAIAPYLPPSDEAPNPRAPGPFAFADARYVEQILQDAGFSEIQINAHEESLKVADTLAEAVQFQTRVGPAARVMAELEGDQRAQALAAVEEALRPFDAEDGLHLDSAVWLVSAKV